ncbi:myeloid differentiation primary response protein MyD88-like [Drosophila nasuta]|uniref:myeloid differentiation primary response protein MyD88-like n=1 Tax=Drosophila nasuta TaxID=42062 RepID=UPI00295F462C|nr:myeloid differentiation primary response protein MyD88-like [Drosophila nasuta]
MRPQFVCHQHSQHSHSHFHKPTDVSRLDRYRYPNMVTPPSPGGDPSTICGALATSGFNRTPLSELSNDTKRQLSCMLNRKKVLRTEDGYERDWRGIAYLAKLTNLINENVPKPMDAVLSTWIQHNPNTAEVGYLEQYLGIIDRWDVQDDIKENIIKDTERFNLKKQQREQLQELSRSSPPPSLELREKNNNSLAQPVNILTLDDEKCLQMGLPLPRYNACVLYAEADIEHAKNIMENLEYPPYNMKLFLKHRDILPGVPFEHVELSEFMTHRCNHLIVVLTEEFLSSRENTYLVNFTQKLQIESHRRKIIPIVYNYKMALPQTLSIYTRLVYEQHSALFNFWNRLASSLYDMNVTQVYAQPNQITAPETPVNALPETPRILVNDADVTDLPDSKLMEPKTYYKALAPSAPVPEQKKSKVRLPVFRIISSSSSTSSTSLAGNGSTEKPLRHAISSSAINDHTHDNKLNTSVSNLSTYSGKKKRFNKISSKLLKTFTRSTSKLQTPC